MSCFWFGHRLPSQAQVIASIGYLDFQCARCKRMVLWEKMPKAIRAMRAEYLRRRSPPQTDSREG